MPTPKVLALAALLVSCAAPIASSSRPAGNGVGNTVHSRAVETTQKWVSKLDADDPSVGRVWDVAHGAFISHDTLIERLAAAQYVLLGEKHDNPDHHVLQAQVLRALIARGAHPRVAFEMIELDQQPLIDAFLATKPVSAAGLGAAVKWDDRGWPTWGDYEPIAQAAVVAHLPILAANLPHAEARAIVHQGLDALGGARVTKLGLDRPLAPEAAASLAEELSASHCGHLPPAMIAPMALAQRARDATMAAILLGDSDAAGAVLIAGAGHARTDRGVPWAIHAQRPAARVVGLAFFEVEPGRLLPQAYAARFGSTKLPFDYVWFTPRLDDDDPCEKFRKK